MPQTDEVFSWLAKPGFFQIGILKTGFYQLRILPKDVQGDYKI